MTRPAKGEATDTKGGGPAEGTIIETSERPAHIVWPRLAEHSMAQTGRTMGMGATHMEVGMTKVRLSVSTLGAVDSYM